MVKTIFLLRVRGRIVGRTVPNAAMTSPACRRLALSEEERATEAGQALIEDAVRRVDRIDVETFSADQAVVTVTGVNIHPSIAKDRMTNAIRVAADFIRGPRMTSGFIRPAV